MDGIVKTGFYGKQTVILSFKHDQITNCFKLTIVINSISSNFNRFNSRPAYNGIMLGIVYWRFATLNLLMSI